MPKTPPETWQAYIEGDRPLHLRNRIVEQNQKLACKAVRQIAFRYIEEWEAEDKLPDLINLGLIGLTKAVERFDPSKGIAFSSFAVPYIRGEVQHFQRDHGDMVRVPRKSRETMNTVMRVVSLRLAAGIPTTPERVATAMGLSTREWEQVQEENKRRPCVDVDEIQVADEVPSWTQFADAKAVNLAIAHLSRLKQELVHGVYFDGLSIAAVARRERIPVQMAEEQLEAALNTLRERLTRSAPILHDEPAIAS